MKKFTLRQNIISKKAEELNINNFPGIDKEKDSCLTFDYIFNNLQLLHLNCITPLMKAFDGNISITSAYRSINLNRAIKGNNNSQHIRGNAIDVISLKHDSSLIWNWCFQNLPSWNIPKEVHILIILLIFHGFIFHGLREIILKQLLFPLQDPIFMKCIKLKKQKE